MSYLAEVGFLSVIIIMVFHSVGPHLASPFYDTVTGQSFTAFNYVVRFLSLNTPLFLYPTEFYLPTESLFSSCFSHFSILVQVLFFFSYQLLYLSTKSWSLLLLFFSLHSSVK